MRLRTIFTYFIISNMREHDFLDLEYLSAKLDEWLLETAIMTAEAKFDLFALEFLKANFNPNQPRVPAGSENGGQWTEVGVVLPDDDNDKSKILEYVTTIKTPSGKRLNRANIFIGGYAD